MLTPWGKATHTTEYDEGIVFYSTPGHGGFYLSEERNREVDPRYREFAAKWSKGWGDQWYEEDCAALAVVITFPEYFDSVTPEMVQNYRRMLDSWVQSGEGY